MCIPWTSKLDRECGAKSNTGQDTVLRNPYHVGMTPRGAELHQEKKCRDTSSGITIG